MAVIPSRTWMPESCVIDRKGYKLYCWSKEFFLTYCQSFLLISYSLHNPPRLSPHSSWQADEITVGNRQQRQRVTRILNIYSFCLSCWTFTVCQSWGEQKPLWFEVCGLFFRHLFLSGDKVPVVHQPGLELFGDFYLYFHTVGKHFLLDTQDNRTEWHYFWPPSRTAQIKHVWNDQHRHY